MAPRLVDLAFGVAAALCMAMCALDSEGVATAEPDSDASLGGSSGSGGSGGTLATDSGSGSVGGSGGLGAAAGTGGATPADASPDGSAGSGGTISLPQTVELTATVADCVSLSNPNPDNCQNGYPSELHIDLAAVSLSDAPSAAYLRFEPGAEIAGATINSVELVLQNVNGSDMSGVVHQVTAFTRPELFGAAPQPGAVIAADLGSVSVGPVSWALSLPPVANQPYCVAVTTSTNDGIGYARLSSPNPPKLRITYTKP